MAPKIPAGAYTVLGGSAYDRKHASFRLRGDRLDPDAITGVTGLTPDLAHRKGDPREPSGPRTSSPWRSGLWAINSAPAVADVGTRLEDHLIWLLDRLEARVAPLQALCNEYELEADFYCGYFMRQPNGGIDIAVSTLARVVALGATFGIDIYAPEPGSLERSMIIEN